MRLLLPRILLAGYLVAVGFVVWSPQPDDPRNPGILAVLARWVAIPGLPAELVYDTLEVAANVALFVPFGVLVAIVVPRLRVWSTTLAGLGTSLLIEGVQLALPTRHSTVSDLVANTAGAFLGATAIAVLRRRRGSAAGTPVSRAAASRPS